MLSGAVGFVRVYRVIKNSLNVIKIGLTGTCGLAGTVLSHYITWKARIFLNEIAQALDKGTGIKFYWGVTGPCMDAS